MASDAHCSGTSIWGNGLHLLLSGEIPVLQDPIILLALESILKKVMNIVANLSLIVSVSQQECQERVINRKATVMSDLQKDKMWTWTGRAWQGVTDRSGSGERPQRQY